ncbi:MAG: hypothetical protein ACJ75R_00755 [Solirubrobacterales bacterium]
MNEVIPGVFHWQARHPRTGGQAHSHLLVEARTVLDPMAPPEAVELMRANPPERIVLSNRHHYREAGRIVEEFACPVLCPESGTYDFDGDDDRDVEPYAYGDRLAPSLIAHEVGSICPDDAALELRSGPGALAFADGLMRHDGRLHFVSDGLLADDPGEVENVKRGLVSSLRRLCELDFDTLLFAHGDPLAEGGRAALEEFVEAHTPG